MALRIKGDPYEDEESLQTSPDLSQIFERKYVKLKRMNTLFTIDGTIVRRGYDNYLVDESQLLKITIDKIEDPKRICIWYLLPY